MALVVRLASGGEDEFDPFPGCKDCGAQMPRDGGKCPERSCGQYTRAEEVRWYNPRAIEESDGSLTVKNMLHHSNPRGRYPSGTWVTYRTT